MNQTQLQSFICSEHEPIVRTNAGKVRGYIENGIYTFHGIRYAEAERFKMPKQISGWEGVTDAQDYGYVCPPPSQTNIFGDIDAPHRYWLESEHCQYLNVWSPALDPTAKKPVMVWLHGGGFVSGSAIELDCYEGGNMAKYGDVVSVSLNHRLNILGFLDLSEYGMEYENSGIVGMEDIVMALRWIQDNIAEFGGDPDNVTIFGESGGGGKVMAILQMGSADGLYSKAIVESGVIGTPTMTKAEARAVAGKVVQAAGGLDALIAMPYPEIRKLMQELGTEVKFQWGPVPETGTYPGPWHVTGIRKGSFEIPVIVGSTFAEFSGGYADLRDKNALSEEEREREIEVFFGAGHAGEICTEYRKAYPCENLYYAKCVDAHERRVTLAFAAARAACAVAPTYNFLFAHETAFKGGMMSNHADELPFVFHTAEYVGAVFNGEQTYKLEDEIFYAWMAFARTGNPNHAKIGEWKPVKPDERNCFVFCRKSENLADHDAGLIELVAKYGKPSRFSFPIS